VFCKITPFAGLSPLATVKNLGQLFRNMMMKNEVPFHFPKRYIYRTVK
jgi:hypothetical protein